MNEATAIRLCMKARDPRGFEFLVKQYRREAYFHAVGFLGDRAAAEDICQESFAKAYVSFPSLKSMHAFYPWFYTILRNRCLNYLRDRKPRVDLLDVPDDSTDPGLAIEGQDTRDAVWSALQKLKPAFREILVLKHLRDASYEDISHILQIPRGTVMSRLYHARKAFEYVYNTTHQKETPHE
jgi:RNA polymerase sigma-70 factor, ECF subfamily